MPDPRAYSSGTEKALFALANGRCYFPDCEAKVIVFVEGHPVNNVHIAHISGANVGSARYDSAMSDEERSAFTNLILLCKAHHTLVDVIEPADYPTALLLQWKAEREGRYADDLSALSNLAVTDLEERLRSVMQEHAPTRIVELEALLAVQFKDESWVTSPPEATKASIDANPGLVVEVALVAQARNVGSLGAFVNSLSLVMPVTLPEGLEAPVTWVGRNDYPSHNPQLPKELRSGEGMTWLWHGHLIHEAAAAAEAPVVIDRFRMEAHLGSGETIGTAEVPIAAIPERN